VGVRVVCGGDVTRACKVYNALVDVVLCGSLLALVERAYQHKHVQLDTAWQLKCLELARVEPAMLGAPPEQVCCV
jgi:hypothetical protein